MRLEAGGSRLGLGSRLEVRGLWREAGGLRVFFVLCLLPLLLLRLRLRLRLRIRLRLLLRLLLLLIPPNP